MKRWTIDYVITVGMVWTFATGLSLQSAPTNAPVPSVKPPVTATTSKPATATNALPLPVAASAATTSAPVSVTATASTPIVGSTTTSALVVANPDMVCPVLPDEKADTKYAKVYEGKIYYLCCARCVTQFTADPKRFIAEMESRSTVYAATDKPAASPEPEPDSVSEVISSVAAASKPEPVLTDEQRTYRFIGYFHPVLVHFPIALIITAALAECLLGFTGRRFFAPISLFCIRLAAFLIVLTALSGWFAASGSSDTSSSAWVLDWHRWFGIGTAVLTGLVAMISLWITHESERGFYRWMLYLAAIAVGVTGHLGGMLVYGLNYFQW